MITLKHLRKYGNLIGNICPICKKSGKKVRCYIVDHGCALQCSKNKNHYFEMSDILFNENNEIIIKLRTKY